MPIFSSDPFQEDIEKATSENNLTEDWSLIMQICDKATNYQDGARLCLKAIIKRLYHSVPRVVLQTLTLLDACVKNCDRKFLLQVASSEFTNEVRKLLPKMHPLASDKLRELIQKWASEEFKDDPELCIIPSLYYKLKSEGYEFPSTEEKKKKTVTLCTNPDGVSSQEEENDIIKAIEISLKDTGRYEVPDEYKNVVPTTKSVREPFKVRALYDFDAAEDNELTIKSGELVLVSDNSNSSWWKGSNHRGEGLFPSSFVTEDLNFTPEEKPKVVEAAAESVAEEPEELDIKLDEGKIEKLINWLNDIDPAEEMTDSDELLLLERQCYGMTPLIEENLQEIDTRIAKLNLVNEKIMAAFDLFHSLSDHATFNSPLQYYPGTLNQHVVQFPHPQVTGPIPPGTMMHQPPVPQNIAMPVPTQNNSQINSMPPGTVQSSIPPHMPSNSSSNPALSSAVTDGSQTAISTSGSSAPTPIPYSQVNTLGYIGNYPVPTQAIPYPMQYGPNMMQPAFSQTSGSLNNVMPIPYALPPMRPYFPMPYYYVNSNFALQQASSATTTTATSGSSQENALKEATATTVNTAPSSIPYTPNYLNDLHNFYANTSNSNEKADNKTSVQEAMGGKSIPNQIKNELLVKKNL